MNNTAFIKAIKLPLRLLVLAILPFAISYFSTLPYQWAVIITLFLTWLDKYLHEVAKEQPFEERNKGLFGVRGLTGF